ncbi:MAG: TIGR03643 family protein [Pontibacterium sp.]
MTDSTTSDIVGMAWCDKTSFDDIKLMTGLSEPEVINLMRTHLKPSSFRMWRKRVTGRHAKHKARNRLKRAHYQQTTPYADRLV